MELKKFNGLNVSSKFAVCGLPIRVDTYKTCPFGCKYCFAENRKIMGYNKVLQVANIPSIRKRLDKVLVNHDFDETNFLDTLISQGITWHAGGLSDPFQPVEKEYGITKELVELTKEYGVSVLFSTKSDTLYDCNPDPELHTFQFSVSNVDNRRDIEPNVPSIESRYKLFRDLKDRGFKVGIRMQPLIPGISDLRILEMFQDADHFNMECIKVTPQNPVSKEFVFDYLGFNPSDFSQIGLLKMKPEIRMSFYQPFIDYFEEHGMSYSIADGDIHYVGNNSCCCGDKLVKKSTTFNNTAMIKSCGMDYTKEQLDEQLIPVKSCKCNQLFTSNRQEGCITVQDFYDKRFYRKSSPFSPDFLYRGE